VFGLPANIDRSVQRARSEATVHALQALSAAVGAATSFDREEWCRKLQPIIQGWEKLRQSGGGDALLAKPTAGATQKRASDGSRAEALAGSDLEPVDMFVQLEEQRAFSIVSKVDKAIQNIAAVMSGSELLSPQVQAIASTLMEHRVPPGWEALWEGPSAPVEWLRAIAMRKLALRQWVKRSAKGELFDHAFDLAELFNPGTFLNALRQQTARKLGCSMDGLSLCSSFAEQELSRAAVPVRIVGLSMQGAGFDGERLTEPSADAPELTSAPTCFLAYLPEEEANDVRGAHATVSLPLYKGTSRECLLFDLEVPIRSGDSPARWVTSGVAFFLSN